MVTNSLSLCLGKSFFLSDSSEAIFIVFLVDRICLFSALDISLHSFLVRNVRFLLKNPLVILQEAGSLSGTNPYFFVPFKIISVSECEIPIKVYQSVGFL